MSKNIVLVVGSLNMDQVVHVRRVPLLGETLLGAGSLRLVPGGKGANQAVAMARLGAPVAIAGRVGGDPFMDMAFLIKQLERMEDSSSQKAEIRSQNSDAPRAAL